MSFKTGHLVRRLLTASSSGRPGCVLLAPALGSGHTRAECRVPPQDPAQARWLAGSVALLSGLLLFLLLPPLLFSRMEGWSYMEGFYFAFITLSTVGFGDYVIGESPQRVAGEAAGGSSATVAIVSTGHLPHASPFGGLEAQSPMDRVV